MTDQQQAIAKVAVGALVESLAAVEADTANVRYITVEVELQRGKLVGGRAWIERGSNVGRLLERS